MFNRRFNNRRDAVGNPTFHLHLVLFVVSGLSGLKLRLHETYISNSCDYGRILPFLDATFDPIEVVPSLPNFAPNVVNWQSMYVISNSSALNQYRANGLKPSSSPFTGYPRGTLPIFILVNLLAGDINLNPGPATANHHHVSSEVKTHDQFVPIKRKRGRKPKWPCGLCGYAVKTQCIQCSFCDTWFHFNCSEATDTTLAYHKMNPDAIWHCPACSVVNFTNSTFFNSDINDSSALELSNSFDSLYDLNDSDIPPVGTSSPNRASFINFEPKVSPIKIQRSGDCAWKCEKLHVPPITVKKSSGVWKVVGDNSSSPSMTESSPSSSSTRNLPPFRNSDQPCKTKNCNSTGSTKKQSNSTVTKKQLGNLNMAIVNCRSIRSKSALFDIFLHIKSCDIIMGTESWLDSTISSAEIFPDGYQVFRRDRDSSGGGVFVVVKDTIPCFVRDDLVMEDTELLWCQATLPDQTVLIGSFYRTPDNSTQSIENLNISLSKIAEQPGSPVIVVGGDFNVPGMEWNVPADVIANNPLQRSLLEMLDDHHLSQLVTFKTRKDANGTENTLDLLLTSHPSLFTDIDHHPGISDHCIVLAKFSTKTILPQKPARKIPLWKSMDTELFKSEVLDLQQKFFKRKPSSKTVEENWTWFRDNLNNTVSSNVPHKVIKGCKRVPWFSSKLKRLCSKKEKLYNKAKQTGKKSDWDKFSNVRKDTDRKVRSAHRQHVKSVLESENPRDFWRYVRSRRSDNIGVQTLKVDGRLYTDDQEKAQVLGKQFESVFTHEDPDPSTLPQMPPSPYPDMPPIEINVDGVKKLLQNINVTKAIGPDLIANQSLKIAADEVAPILQFIFQQTLDTGHLPLDWRRANITPLFKKGSTIIPANYRPVSLTCTCCKLIEHIIDSHLMKHLSKWNILAENQHAFRRARSCETQLILTTHDLASHLDNGHSTDMAILDFSKAFDVMPHERILTKLEYYGIRNNTKNWIRTFLTMRFQRVVVNGKSSDWVPVLSGAPQGTVLGPHLFLLHINDIHQNVSSTTRLFADDCLVYRPIKNTEDERILQDDLDTMVKWAETWGMRFNPSKCQTMRITRKRDPGTPNYRMLGVDLENTDSCQYLGIQLQNDLRWNRQVTHAAGKASRILNFIKRNFYHASSSTKEKLYHTLVRPHLDYASAAWDPYTSNNIDHLEAVQKRAARFVTNTYGRDTSISAIIKSLNWPTLEDRRRDYRLFCFFKILINAMDIKYQDYIAPKVDRNRRGHNRQFQQYHTKTDAFANSFFVKTLKDWNNLPPHIIAATKTETFKTDLETLRANTAKTQDQDFKL